MTTDIDDRAPLPPPVLTLQPGRITTPLLPGRAEASPDVGRVIARADGSSAVWDPAFELEPTELAADDRRWFLPLLPVRALLSLALLAVAAGSGYLVLLLTVLRTTTQTPTSIDAFVDDYTTGSVVTCLSFLLAFLLQGAWSMAQAWNARRTNLLAPRPTTLLLHFVVGPAIIVASTALDGWEAWFVGIVGVVVTYALWLRSFSVMRVVGQMVDADASRLGPWGLVMGVHVVIALLSGPGVYLDPDVRLVFLIVFLGIQVFVFLAASITSWNAMAELDRATRTRPQFRRAA